MEKLFTNRNESIPEVSQLLRKNIGSIESAKVRFGGKNVIELVSSLLLRIGRKNV